MVKRLNWLLVYLLFSIGIMAQSGGRKQYNSYKGLVMAGYQGWFNTPGDGSAVDGIITMVVKDFVRDRVP